MPTAGGQPGDTGTLEFAGGGALPIATTVYDDGKDEIVHVTCRRRGAVLPAPGADRARGARLGAALPA